MPFGERVRELREQKSWTQKQLAQRLAVSMSYISKIENERLHFGDFPSAKFILRLAQELCADEDELLLLAEKVPEAIRTRMRQRPDAFRTFAALDDNAMDKVLRLATKRTK